MKTRLKTTARSMTLLLVALGSLSAQAGEADSQGYVMVVFEDEKGAHAILEGKPEEFVSRVARGRAGRVGDVTGQVNLCVAYAKTRQVELATEACDNALKRAALTDRAIAMTNRGVLHAVAGETAAAMEMFEKARKFGAVEEIAERNLALLRSDLTADGS